MTQDKGPTTYEDGKPARTEKPFRGLPMSKPDQPSGEPAPSSDAPAAPATPPKK